MTTINDIVEAQAQAALVTQTPKIPKGKIRVCSDSEVELFTATGWVLVATYVLSSFAHATEQELPPENPNDNYHNQYRSMRDVRTRAMPTTVLRFVLVYDENSALADAAAELEAARQRVRTLETAVEHDERARRTLDDKIESLTSSVEHYKRREETLVGQRNAADEAKRLAEQGLAAERQKVQKLTTAIGTVAAEKILADEAKQA